MADRRIQNLWLLYVLADLCAVVAAYYISLYIRFDWKYGTGIFHSINKAVGVNRPGSLGPSYEMFYQASAFRIICLLFILLCVLYALRDLYTERRFIIRRSHGANILLANITALALIYAYFYLRRNTFHPRSMVALIILINTFSCVMFRDLVDRLLVWLRKSWAVDLWDVVLIGEGRHADLIERIIRTNEPHGLRIVDRLNISPHADVESALDACRESAMKHRASMFIVADRDMDVPQVMRFLEMADELDMPVKLLSDKLDVLINRARIRFDVARGSPLYHFASPSTAQRFRWFKVVGSRWLAALILLTLSPVLLMLALAIRLTSRGPVFFRQERIGVNRKPFRIFKFRTMYADAEDRIEDMEALNESEGGLFKISNDPRVTPVGKFLRKYSLDELPQFINVVRGDMTIVGPRPLPQRDFENYYADWHYSRHNGLPGLTCLWQVSGRSDLDFHSMCILDVFYLRNQNWVLDLKIVLRTVSVVVFADGAY